MSRDQLTLVRSSSTCWSRHWTVAPSSTCAGANFACPPRRHTASVQSPRIDRGAGSAGRRSQHLDGRMNGGDRQLRARDRNGTAELAPRRRDGGGRRHVPFQPDRRDDARFPEDAAAVERRKGDHGVLDVGGQRREVTGHAFERATLGEAGQTDQLALGQDRHRLERLGTRPHQVPDYEQSAGNGGQRHDVAAVEMMHGRVVRDQAGGRPAVSVAAAAPHAGTSPRRAPR